VSAREDMFNVVGKPLVQEEGGEWRAEETRGGWALPQKVEHPQLKFLVAPLVLDFDHGIDISIMQSILHL